MPITPATKPDPGAFTFTVGKLDAGMAILLGERAHLIEFPSILLPPNTTAGSIVNISVHQNREEEVRRDREFWALQDDILKEFGEGVPEKPELKLRNVTQTSITLEWSSLSLATSTLRSLDLYRNNIRLASIPSPLTNTSTKVSGLELSTPYTFHLVLRTTAGTFLSNIINCTTHSMTDTSGIVVCFGTVLDPDNANRQDTLLMDNCKMALREMGAKWSDKIEIDTTHFICTTPGSIGQADGGSAPGVLYQRAVQLSIPILQPGWILACHSEKKMVPVAQYYLGASPPALRSAGHTSTMSLSQARSPTNPTSATTPTQRRELMPPAVHSAPVVQPSKQVVKSETIPENPPAAPGPPASAPGAPSDPAPTQAPTSAPALTQAETETEIESPSPSKKTPPSTLSDKSTKRKSRLGSMNKDFKFPDPSSPTSPNSTASMNALYAGTPPLSRRTSAVAVGGEGEGEGNGGKEGEEEGGEEGVKSLSQRVEEVNPSSIEVLPPPPVEKEKRASIGGRGFGDDEDEVGDTVEIEL